MCRFARYLFKMKVIIAVIFLFILSINNELSGTEKLQIATYNQPPYSYSVSGIQTGSVTEIVHTLINISGLSVDIIEYPYKRAIFLASSNENILIYPLLRTSENENQFKWIGKIRDRRVSFF